MAAKKSASNAAEPTSAFADALPMSAFADAAREQYETAMSAFTDNAEKFRTQSEETFAAARDGFDAASERMRTASADIIAHAREEMADAVDLANELARAKSVTDAIELQRSYWTKLLDARVARAKSLTDASVEATREAFAPFNKSLNTASFFAPAFDKFFPFASK